MPKEAVLIVICHLGKLPKHILRGRLLAMLLFLPREKGSHLARRHRLVLLTRGALPLSARERLELLE